MAYDKINHAEHQTMQRTAASVAKMKAGMTQSLDMISEYNDHKLASGVCKRIMNHIKEFEQKLDDEHEVLLKLASFGQGITMAVANISYSDPNILIFSGYVGGQFSTLIQHISQTQFPACRRKKDDPEKPARRIGFRPPNED